METLTPLDKLDIVLEFLKYKEKPPKARIGEIVEGIFDKVHANETEVLQIVNKLIKDGYFIKEDVIENRVVHSPVETPENIRYYLITFEGSFFLNNPGGYVKQAAIDARTEKRIKRNERLLIGGTWFAGAAAILLLLWQVWIWFYPLHANYPYWFWEKISTH